MTLDFLFQEGSTVTIEMIAGDSRIFLNEDDSISRDGKTDKGLGVILERMTETRDDTTLNLYRIMVIDGRYDVHRNDLGQLWANEFELSEEVKSA